MSRSLNKALLIGNLGSDPEIRATADGTRVAGFSVATNRSWTDREGQAQERAEWHRIIAWANLAELAERYLRKGDRVYLEGEIQYRTYEDREGVTKYVTEIRARELVMLGGRNGDAPAGKQAAREPAAVGSGVASEGFDGPELPEDDLPF